MTRSIRIDRHVLASNASSFDTAWRTFGWTPAIAGELASRLEEQVPWATAAAASARPARLAGDPAIVLDPANIDGLDFAFQPIDGRLAASVWGAIGERRSDAGEWRVATATLLLDDEAFDAIAGNPFAIFESLVRRGDSWTSLPEPAQIEPLVLEASADVRERFEGGRQREIERLRAALVARIGEPALAQRLATVYEAIARVRRPPGPRHVAIRRTQDSTVPLIARLAWLSLPLADRVSTSFTTEQRTTQRPRATLLVLTREWGEFVPEGAMLAEGRNGAAPEPGRAYWATAIAGGRGGARLRTLERCAAARGWSLLDRDDFAAIQAVAVWSDAWLRDGPSRALAERLVDIDTARDGASPRLRAIGRVAALAAVSGAAPAGRGRSSRAARPAWLDIDANPTHWLLDIAARTGPGAVRTLRAAVRTLQRRGADERRLAGALRCEAVARGAVPLLELHRLHHEERPAGDAVSSAPDDAVAAGPLRAVAGVALTNDAALVMPILQLVRQNAGLDAARAFAARVFDDAAAANGLRDDAAIEVMLRLLWLQPDAGACLAERALVANRDTAPALIVRLMTAPAPLPTFLALRRLLLERVLPGAVVVDHTQMLRLRSLSPALASHLAAVGERLNV